MVGPNQPRQIYPLGHPVSAHDDRFTVGLVLDVVRVLTKHGFPAVASGVDFLRFQDTLFRFIYGTEGGK